MALLRLMILALLAYLGWRLLRGVLSSGEPHAQRGTLRDQQEMTVQDTLMEDPVCHILVPKKQAIRLRRNGKTHYFCSEACCDKFTDNSRGEK